MHATDGKVTVVADTTTPPKHDVVTARPAGQPHPQPNAAPAQPRSAFEAAAASYQPPLECALCGVSTRDDGDGDAHGRVVGFMLNGALATVHELCARWAHQSEAVDQARATDS